MKITILFAICVGIDWAELFRVHSQSVFMPESKIIRWIYFFKHGPATCQLQQVKHLSFTGILTERKEDNGWC